MSLKIAKRMDIPSPAAEFREQVLSLKRAMADVIVGQDEVVLGAIVGLLAPGHVLLEGPPGVGKTLLVKTLSRLIELKAARVQFTPDLLPSDILGGATLVRNDAGSEVLAFQKGPIFANLVLADELNRASPRTQAAFLEAMEERQVTALGESHALAEPFMVLATQNPADEGTYPLPRSELDRFLLHVRVQNPDRGELVQILERAGANRLEVAAPVCDRDTVIELRAVAREVVVAPDLLEKTAAIVDATHPERTTAPRIVKENVLAGASPRAALAMLRSGRVMAAIAGRNHLAAIDLRQVSRAALRHRLVLDPLTLANSQDRDAFVDEIIDAVVAQVL